MSCISRRQHWQVHGQTNISLWTKLQHAVWRVRVALSGPKAPSFGFARGPRWPALLGLPVLGRERIRRLLHTGRVVPWLRVGVVGTAADDSHLFAQRHKLQNHFLKLVNCTAGIKRPLSHWKIDSMISPERHPLRLA